MSVSESISDVIKNKLLAGIMAFVFGLLTWNVHTTYQTSLKLTEINSSVNQLITENLVSRTAILETLVTRNTLDIQGIKDADKE